MRRGTRARKRAREHDSSAREHSVQHGAANSSDGMDEEAWGSALSLQSSRRHARGKGVCGEMKCPPSAAQSPSLAAHARPLRQATRRAARDAGNDPSQQDGPPDIFGHVYMPCKKGRNGTSKNEKNGQVRERPEMPSTGSVGSNIAERGKRATEDDTAIREQMDASSAAPRPPSLHSRVTSQAGLPFATSPPVALLWTGVCPICGHFAPTPRPLYDLCPRCVPLGTLRPPIPVFSGSLAILRALTAGWLVI